MLPTEAKSTFTSATTPVDEGELFDGEGEDLEEADLLSECRQEPNDTENQGQELDGTEHPELQVRERLEIEQTKHQNLSEEIMCDLAFLTDVNSLFVKHNSTSLLFKPHMSRFMVAYSKARASVKKRMLEEKTCHER